MNVLLRSVACVIVFGCCLVAHATTPNSSNISVVGKGYILNVGQWPEHVVAVAKQQNMDVWITRSGLVLDHFKQDKNNREGVVVQATWVTEPSTRNIEVSANSVGFPVTFYTSRGTFVTRCVPTLAIKNIGDGVHADFEMDKGLVRYNFDVEKVSSASPVSLEFDGVARTTINETSLVLQASNGLNITMGGLVVSSRNSVQNAQFVNNSDNGIVAIHVPDAVIGTSLRIDPIVYGTYLGNAGDDKVVGVDILNSTTVAFTGTTDGLSFPDGIGGYSKSAKGSKEVFVAFMNNSLTTYQGFTFFGGTQDDVARTTTKDSQGNLIVCGETVSADMPITTAVAGQTSKGAIDAFVMKLDPTGTTLLFSTYLGGNKDDFPLAVTTDVNDNVYVVGKTSSNNSFPTTGGFQKTFGGLFDCFLTKLSASGSSYLYSTYYGREGNEQFNGVTVDAGGSVYCIGTTNSSNFQTVPVPSGGPFGNPNRRPYDRTFNGGTTDAIMVKFLDNDGGVAFSTYFGGAGDDEGIGIFVDALSRAYGIGTTTSADLPASAGFQQTKAGGKDIMWFGISADGRELENCTYFGGSGDENVAFVKREASNNAVVVGSTTSSDFRLQGAGAIDVRRGANDGFIAEFNNSAVAYSTLIEGILTETVSAVDIDAVGDYYFGVTTTSDNFEPVNRSNTQEAGGGASDVYAGKWAKGTLELAAPLGGELFCLGKPVNISWGTLELADSVKYKVEISEDNGVSWKTIDSNRAGKSYSWQPKPPAGDRLVRVTSSRGHIDFSKSSFELVSPPSIVTQPVSVSGCSGDSATLQVQAEGADLTYQWRKGGQNIANAKSATYKIAAINATTTGKYDVLIGGRCTPSVTSSAVDVAQTTSPIISTQPASVTVQESKKLELKVVAQGTSLTYVWKKNGTVLEGKTTATLVIDAVVPADAGDYTCEISSKCGSSISQAATVTVTPTNSITEDEENGYSLVVKGPLPANDYTNIVLRGFSGTALITITTVQGEIVGVYPVNAEITSELTIPTVALPSGMYTISAKVQGTVLNVAIVVTH